MTGEDAEPIPREVHKGTGDAGAFVFGYAEEVGGSGGDSIDVTVLTESLLGAGASGGASASLFSHGIAIPMIDAATAAKSRAMTSVWIGCSTKTFAPCSRVTKIAAPGVTGARRWF